MSSSNNYVIHIYIFTVGNDKWYIILLNNNEWK